MTALLALLLAVEPWAAMADRDLRAIHDVLVENHPGPVDPQNPHYRDWLEAGLKAATERAAQARSYEDYLRALRFYTNGFQDGHLGIGLELVREAVVWPGFIVGPGAEVRVAEADAGVARGDRIASCDGKTVDALQRERVDPYHWNRGIPHQRALQTWRLFVLPRQEREARFKSCSTGARTVQLRWRRIDRAEYEKLAEAARGRDRTLGMRKVSGVWLLTIPSFAWSGDERVKQFRGFLAEIASHLEELRAGKVVLDVRGNHGGNSTWGEEVAAALWGHEWQERISESFDETVDWRASPANLAFMESMLERDRSAGLETAARRLARTCDAIRAAIAAHRPLARVDEPPKPLPAAKPKNPVTGRVFLLTDSECASACLDFADLVRRLPSVTHVGLPTSADAIYIDNTYADLPGGVAGLGYSMKVFRNRVRGNNEWYEPQIRWPGGEMGDDAVARWIAGL